MEEFNEQLMCYFKYYETALELEEEGPFCEPDYDNITCWPPTLAGRNASVRCPVYFHLQAHRSCLNNGQWAPHRIDYNECLNPPPVPTYPPSLTVESYLSYVYIVGCCLSLVLLTISLFIFCYFKSLQCTRIAIHKNLVVSFILRYICMIVVLHTYTTAEIALVEGDNGIQQNWKNPLKNTPGMCRFFLVVLEYFSMANIFWMFVEGIYLTSRISVAVFSRESNFKVYIFVGWVTPSYAVITWAVLMRYHGSSKPCWEDYLESPYIWIVRAPMIAAIFVNSGFLINIIRILVTKLRASNTVETAQMRKAVKAVAVLFPLLGLTNLVFLWTPNERGLSENIYQVVHAVLLSAQGIFVSVIYCFLNAEVRQAITRRLSNNMDPYGNNTRARRTTQTHTNGSCVIATSSEVAMAVTFQKKLHPSSPNDYQMNEMKPFREEMEDTLCEENEERQRLQKPNKDRRNTMENIEEDEDENPEKQHILSHSM
ncbi:corticotropin-releasing factor receptor 2-like [Amphiura filiformis]|uniref:corticotropin-releasing factor receptor 2-like n=1 Tax=Amphiura filiformis TaxID=82378 RepID=UPI003B214955